MDLNVFGAYLHGWGMSIATQRAKKCQNRTPGVKVMAEMVKLGTLKLGGAEVPLGMGGSTARVGIFRRSNRGTIFGRKWMISGPKLDGFRG